MFDLFASIPGPAWALGIGGIIVGVWSIASRYVSNDEPADEPLNVNLGDMI